MGRATWRRCFLALGIAAAVGFAAGCPAEAGKAPDFDLPDLAGRNIRLSEALAEGPVILDFWATWCKPCIKGFPGLQEIHDEYRDRGLRVFAVSIDSPRSRARVGSFVKSSKYTFEVLLDTQGLVAKKYQAVVIPRTVLIGPDGELLLALTGYRPANHEKLRKVLRQILPEPPAEGDGDGVD
jgi:peroxiredoxin